MTYSVGGLIQAADYNTFRNNLNAIWSTGSGDSGWGQTALSAVSIQSGEVAAVNWSTLVNTLATAGSQTATTLTARTAPVSGNVIAILANVATDITSVTTRRGFATGIQSSTPTWTGSISKTTDTGVPGISGWSIQWTQDVIFPSSAQTRYFWNAGGLIRLRMSKSSTGTDIDPDWNTFVSTVGDLYISGRVNNANQVIAGVTYTGFTRIGGSGTPSPNLTTTGWYQIPGPIGTSTTLFQLNNSVYPYSSSFIRVQAAEVFTTFPTTGLRLTTTWFQSAQFYQTGISGGTATTSPFTAFGTAPAVLCSVFTPSTAQGLANTWGTPTVTSSVV
jgi:hypothetical protein